MAMMDLIIQGKEGMVDESKSGSGFGADSPLSSG